MTAPPDLAAIGHVYYASASSYVPGAVPSKSMQDAIDLLGDADRVRLAEMAVGRVLAMGAREPRPSDIDEYDFCRCVLAACMDRLDMSGAHKI